MTQLTDAQVAGVVIKAGFQDTAAIDAVSVALAESGGRTDAVGQNHDKWHSLDRGLFQINSHWHPEVSAAAAFDPTQAAAAAFTISKGGKSWTAWSTWPVAAAAQRGRATLALHAYVQSVVDGAVGGVTLNPFNAGTVDIKGGLDELGNAASNVTGGITDVGHAVAAIAVIAAHAGEWMSNPHNWLRVAMVAGGAVSVVVALVLLAESGAAGSTAAGAATKTKHAAELAALA